MPCVLWRPARSAPDTHESRRLTNKPPCTLHRTTPATAPPPRHARRPDEMSSASKQHDFTCAKENQRQERQFHHGEHREHREEENLAPLPPPAAAHVYLYLAGVPGAAAPASELTLRASAAASVLSTQSTPHSSEYRCRANNWGTSQTSSWGTMKSLAGTFAVFACLCYTAARSASTATDIGNVLAASHLPVVR